MARDLRILMVEDVPEEAEVVQRELRKSGLVFTAQRVQTASELGAALDTFVPDLVLADSKLPGFDGSRALELVKERSPRTPVIMVTGALGDEAAVELLIAGARDYVLKDRLARLGSAVKRVLEEEEERRIREQLEQALGDAADKERRRLAQELHDGLGQELTGLGLLADGLLMQADRADLPAQPELVRLAEITRHAIKACREIAHGLSCLGAGGGISEALRALVARVSGPPGPQVSLRLDVHTSLTISRESSEHLYRIAQEAIANAIKHSDAAHIEVCLEADERMVRLRVLDDGHGPLMQPEESPGLGLRTMQNRARAIGASLSITGREGHGTALVCEVPHSVNVQARRSNR